MKQRFITHKEIRAEWMKSPAYERAFRDSEVEYQIARQIIGARIKRKMSQSDLARKVGTGQAVISRLESMNSKSSISLLQRVARALEIKINIVVQ